jgi:hypothetical protein
MPDPNSSAAAGSRRAGPPPSGIGTKEALAEALPLMAPPPPGPGPGPTLSPLPGPPGGELHIGLLLAAAVHIVVLLRDVCVLAFTTIELVPGVVVSRPAV